MYEQVEQRELVCDTVRQGRLTITARFTAIIKKNNGMLNKLHSHHSAIQYNM